MHFPEHSLRKTHLTLMATNRANAAATTTPGVAARRPAAGNVTPIARQRRMRYGQLPVPAKRADLYWGINQPELKSVTNAQLCKLVLDTPEYEKTLGEKLDEIDERNRTGWGNRAGRPQRWSARELEAVFVYRRVSGLPTIKRTLERIHFDPEAQQLLGFTGGTPSAPTLTRHLKQHFEADERRDLYREFDRLLRQRVVQLPGFDEEARKMGLDGSQQGTRYTPPIPKAYKGGKLTGTIANGSIRKGKPGAITAPDAGFVGKAGGPKAGQGWQFVGLFSEHGTLLGWDISALNTGEPDAAQRVFDDYQREVLPHRGTKTVSVCAADGGFSSTGIRTRLQELRIVPNIHKASHAEGSKSNVKKLDKMRWAFSHPSKPQYGNWGSNGHAEITCDCGQGVIERVFSASKTGHLTIATRGSCPQCGQVTITSGRWRRTRGSSSQGTFKWVLAVDGEEPDPAVGNSLTFHDPISRGYGRGRFGWGESIHATLERRFGLLKQRSWMRSRIEVETEFAIAASAISVLLLERAERASYQTQAAIQATG
jgi:hypothetical protein